MILLENQISSLIHLLVNGGRDSMTDGSSKSGRHSCEVLHHIPCEISLLSFTSPPRSVIAPKPKSALDSMLKHRNQIETVGKWAHLPEGRVARPTQGVRLSSTLQWFFNDLCKSRHLSKICTYMHVRVHDIHIVCIHEWLGQSPRELTLVC